MNYKNCPHFLEICKVISKEIALEDVSFEIEDVNGCPNCLGEEETICCIWVKLMITNDLSDQIGTNTPKITIETLDKRIEEIARALVKKQNN